MMVLARTLTAPNHQGVPKTEIVMITRFTLACLVLLSFACATTATLADEPKSPTFKVFVSYVSDFARFHDADWVHVSHTPREVTFAYFTVDKPSSTIRVLEEMDRRGLRPAIYEELIAFDKAFLKEGEKWPVALGSVVQYGDNRYVVSDLYGDGDGHILAPHYVDDAHTWDDRPLFLVVRKAS